MSGRRRPNSTRNTRADRVPRDRVQPRSSATPRQNGRDGRDRERRRPADVDVTKSTSNLFTRPQTPSKTTPTPNGHSKSSGPPSMDDARRRSASVDDRATTHASQDTDPDVSRPVFQFKVGMRVGVALGECFLQVQRLESSVLEMNRISDELRDFMNFLSDGFQEAHNHSASPARDGGQAMSASPIPEDTERENTITPFQQVLTLNTTLERSQHDCSKRMTSVLKGLKQLQIRLEEMDEVNTKIERSNHFHGGGVERADVQLLRNELEKARSESNKMRRQAEESRRKFEETKALLETREAQLDNDAEAIERQSEHLRADTERLLKEKEDVRRQKDNWQALIEEQKELKEQLNRREQMLNESQKQLIALQNTLAQKEAHLHRKAKKLRGRERRINQNLMSLRPAGGVFYDGSSYAGSDYAPSEASSKLTYFSDGDTEIASVNSLESDDEMDRRY